MSRASPSSLPLRTSPSPPPPSRSSGGRPFKGPRPPALAVTWMAVPDAAQCLMRPPSFPVKMPGAPYALIRGGRVRMWLHLLGKASRPCGSRRARLFFLSFSFFFITPFFNSSQPCARASFDCCLVSLTFTRPGWLVVPLKKKTCTQRAWHAAICCRQGFCEFTELKSRLKKKKKKKGGRRRERESLFLLTLGAVSS